MRTLKAVLLSILAVVLVVSLVACGAPQPQSYAVTFDFNYDGAPAPQVFTVESGERATKPTQDPTRTGYVFTGWYVDKDCKIEQKFLSSGVTQSPVNKITADTTFYAGWQKEGSQAKTLVSISAIYTGSKVAINAELNKALIVVTATYDDDSTKTVTDFEVTGFDSSTVGTKEVTITYTEGSVSKSTTITVEVYDPMPSATLKSITAEYVGSGVYVGAQPNKADIVVTATYTNGTDKTVTNFTLSTLDSSTVGDKQVTITYTEGDMTKECQLTINVIKTPELLSISAVYNGENIDIGGTLNTDDIVVTATFDVGEPQIVTGYSIDGFDSATAGEKLLTISYTYNSVTKTCQITVVVYDSNEEATFQSIKATLNIEGVIFVDTAITRDSFTVVKVMSDNSTVKITDTQNIQVTLQSGEPTQEGVATYLITYDGKQTTVDITFTRKLTGIVIKEDSVTVDYNGALVITVTAQFAGADDVVLTAENYTTNFDPKAVGTNTVTVTYQENGVEVTDTVEVTVNDMNKTTYYFYNKDSWENVYAYAWYEEQGTIVPKAGDYVIIGSFCQWNADTSVYLTYDEVGNQYVFQGLQLNEGDTFKIAKLGEADHTYYNQLESAVDTALYTTDNDGNIVIKQTGVYDFYFKAHSNQLYFGKGTQANKPNQGIVSVEVLGAFPGTAMTPVADNLGWYSVEVYDGAQFIIFSNGDTLQTDNLTLDVNKPYYDGSAWTDSMPSILHSIEVALAENTYNYLNKTLTADSFVITQVMSNGDRIVLEGTEGVEVTLKEGSTTATLGKATYVVTYQGKSAEITVDVVKELNGITAVAQQTTVFVGTELQLTVTATYEGLESALVTGFTTNYQKDQVGVQNVVVSYTENGITKTFEIEITVVDIDRIGAVLDKQGTIFVGTTLITADFTVTKVLTNGTEEQITDTDNISIEVTAGSINTAGTVTYTITYQGHTTTVDVTYIRKLTSISATPTEQTVDYNTAINLTVTAHFDGADDVVLTAEQYTTDFVATKVGTNTVTITYVENGITVQTTVQVTVNEPTEVIELQSIEATLKADVYNFVGETLTADKFDIVKVMSDGSRVPLEGTDGVSIELKEGSSVDAVGSAVYVITYQEKTTEVTVNVIKKLTGITAVAQETTLKYNQELVLTVTATYNGAENAEVVDFTTDYNKQLVAEQTVTVTYTENGITVTTTVTVTVVRTATSIEVTTDLTTVDHNSTLDNSQLTVTATYDDGTTGVIAEGFTVDYDFSTVGVATITVSYIVDDSTTLQDSVVVTVVKVWESIKAVYSGGEVDVNGTLDTTKVAVYKVYSDGTEELIEDTASYTIGALDATQEGTQQVTVTLKEQPQMTTTFEVVVNDVEILYFYNYANWANVYAHTWVDGEESPVATAWPGNLMTKEADSNWWYITVDTDCNRIIFNNNDTAYTLQTATITIDFAQPYYAILGWSDVKSVENIIVLDLAVSSWNDAGARFAVCYWQEGGTQYWKDLQGIAGENKNEILNYKYYAVDISDVADQIDFFVLCRMNPATSDNNWDQGTKWNQTNDLVTSNGLYVTIPQGTWDKQEQQRPV